MFFFVYIYYIFDLFSIISAIDTMDLNTALDEAKLAINYFFNNKFTEARNLMKPWYIIIHTI